MKRLFKTKKSKIVACTLITMLLIGAILLSFRAKRTSFYCDTKTENAQSQNLQSMESDSVIDTESASDNEISISEQKLITTWTLSFETKNYEDTMTKLYESVSKSGGYIESESESKEADGTMYDSLVIRIPQEQSEEWMTGADDFATIISKSKNIEDVSLQYVDVNSRLDALYSQQEALEDLLKKAENISDIMEIRDNLSDVNYEIESYKSQLLYLDNAINYDTVNVTITEVSIGTNKDSSFFGEIRNRFEKSCYDIAQAGRSFLVALFGYSLYILITVFALFLIVFFNKKRKIKHNAKKESESDPTE